MSRVEDWVGCVAPQGRAPPRGRAGLQQSWSGCLVAGAPCAYDRYPGSFMRRKTTIIL